MYQTKPNKSFPVCGVVVFILSALFFIGSLTVFKPCGQTEEGTWMTCHWAGVAVSATAAVLCVQSLFHIIAGNKVKNGIALAMLPTALSVIFIPEILIPLCMMKTMRCHSLLRPASIIFPVLINLVLSVDLFGRKQ